MNNLETFQLQIPGLFWQIKSWHSFPQGRWARGGVGAPSGRVRLSCSPWSPPLLHTCCLTRGHGCLRLPEGWSALLSMNSRPLGKRLTPVQSRVFPTWPLGPLEYWGSAPEATCDWISSPCASYNHLPTGGFAKQIIREKLSPMKLNKSTKNLGMTREGHPEPRWSREGPPEAFWNQEQAEPWSQRHFVLLLWSKWNSLMRLSWDDSDNTKEVAGAKRVYCYTY